MKYNEACACGATMSVETERPTEFARAKSQWAIDHRPHGENTITIENKRLMLEYAEMEAKVKAIEDTAYPAQVLAYAVSIVDRKGGANMYQGLVDPGNGFQWEDPNSSIMVSIQPTSMKLPDLEEKELTEAEAKKYDPSKEVSTLGMTASTSMSPPGRSMNKLQKQLAEQVAKDAEKLIFKKTLMVTPKQIRESVLGKTEVSDEQGKQAQSKRDEGAKASKKVATRSRIRRDDVGRRRDPRQG